MAAKKAPPPVTAYYNGKAAGMEYVPDAKQRFKYACMRVVDNARDGYVVEGEKVYYLTREKRSAKFLTGEEREAALTAIYKMQNDSSLAGLSLGPAGSLASLHPR